MFHYVNSEPPDHMKNKGVGDKIDVTPRQDGGVMKEIRVEGAGDFYANVNDKVELEYIGYVGDVEAEEYIFDSSEKDGKTFKFTVLKGQVVRGFEAAVMTMKRGERAMLTLAPNYAFGKAGAPPRIPADTPVMFDTKILSIEPQDLSPEQDKTITKHVLTKGVGWASPSEGNFVKLNITGYCANRKFLDGEKEFVYGEGADPQIGIPDFVEEYLSEWRVGENSELKFDAKHCYGNHGCPALDIPPGADLTFTIKLISFEKSKDLWEMAEAERLDQCDIYKAKGNQYYKRREFGMARKFYLKTVDNLEFDLLMQGEDESRRKQILAQGFVNLAQAYLKEENFPEARKCCDKVLEFEPDNVKALYRRGLAFYNTKDYTEALEDFRHVIRLDPSNRAARNHIILCENHARQSACSDREMYQRMFTSSSEAGSESERPSSGMDDIGNWDNSMARGMMTLEQEASAWDEALPLKGDNNHGNH